MDDYLNSNSNDYEDNRNEEDELTYIDKRGQTVTLELNRKNCCRPVRRDCKEYGKKKKKIKCKVIKGRKCCGKKSEKCSCSKLKSFFKGMASKTMKKINRMKKHRVKKKNKKKDKSVTKTGGLRKHDLKRSVKPSENPSFLYELLHQTKRQGKNPNPKCTSKSDLR